MRKLGKPPYLITLIMDCVIILFGRKLEPVKPDYERQFLTPSWSEALKVIIILSINWRRYLIPEDCLFFLSIAGDGWHQVSVQLAKFPKGQHQCRDCWLDATILELSFIYLRSREASLRERGWSHSMDHLDGYVLRDKQRRSSFESTFYSSH